MTLYDIYRTNSGNIIVEPTTTIYTKHSISEIELPKTVKTFNRILGDCEVKSFKIRNTEDDNIHIVSVNLDMSDGEIREYIEMLEEDFDDDELDDSFDFESYRAKVMQLLDERENA